MSPERSETAHVRSNGQITLPASVRRVAGLQEGDVVECEALDDGSVLLRPVAMIDRVEADLMLRAESKGLDPDAPGGLRERAAELARRRLLPPLTGRRLGELIDRYERGELSRRRFIGHALILGLPVSVLSTLLGTNLRADPGFPLPGLVANEEAPPPATRPRVRISQAFHSLLYLPLYIAEDAGFFDEEGVDVDLETAGGGPEAWSTVVAGLADYSVHDPVFAVRAHERGTTDAVVVGTICAGQAIVAVSRDEAIGRTQDPAVFITETLAGRTVATQPEPDSQWAMLQFLGFLYGVAMNKDYANLQVPIGCEPQPVWEERADVALAFPPVADIAIAEGMHEVFDASSYFGPFLLSALCSRRRYIQDHPFAHQAVITALEKAAQYAHAFPGEAVRIAQRQFSDADPDTIASATLRCLQRNFVAQHIAVDDEAWRENGIIHRFVGTLRTYHELAEIVDNDAALHAYRSLGNLALTWSGPRALAERPRKTLSG
ncbi:MAG TPA: ABC transporter substrate-binding protein [Egibacteraceae bacterium]|nr:ABC transporter substrate-binding protein [Egibacteraceae bacterium]